MCVTLIFFPVAGFAGLVFVKVKMRLEQHLRKLINEDVESVLFRKEVNEDNLDEKVNEVCRY